MVYLVFRETHEIIESVFQDVDDSGYLVNSCKFQVSINRLRDHKGSLRAPESGSLRAPDHLEHHGIT